VTKKKEKHEVLSMGRRVPTTRHLHEQGSEREALLAETTNVGEKRDAVRYQRELTMDGQ